jgi:hypothetical protein
VLAGRAIRLSRPITAELPSGVCGFGKNRDEKKSGNGGRSAAARVMNRDIGRLTLATWLMKRLTFGSTKREPRRARFGGGLSGRSLRFCEKPRYENARQSRRKGRARENAFYALPPEKRRLA